MDRTHERVGARDAALNRLNRVTVWTAVGAVAAAGIFSVVAAATIPGKASPKASTGPSPGAARSDPGSATLHTRHHLDQGTISAPAGPPVAVSGASH